MARPRAETLRIARRGDLIVERDPSRPSGRLLLQGNMEASYVDLADASYLEFDYMRWLRIVLRVVRARRVLHIGGGACALPRALAAEDPQSRQEVCEVDSDVLELARSHMGLRRAPGLRVRHAEGRAFLAEQPDASRDAIVVDAFVAAAVPRRLITAEACAEYARVAPLAIVNVVDDRSARDVRLIAAGLATAYLNVWSLGQRVGNTIVAGARRPVDLGRIAARAAGDPAPPRLTPPNAMASLLEGGRPALRDPEDAG